MKSCLTLFLQILFETSLVLSRVTPERLRLRQASCLFFQVHIGNLFCQALKSFLAVVIFLLRLSEYSFKFFSKANSFGYLFCHALFECPFLTSQMIISLCNFCTSISLKNTFEFVIWAKFPLIKKYFQGFPSDLPARLNAECRSEIFFLKTFKMRLFITILRAPESSKVVFTTAAKRGKLELKEIKVCIKC